ncbi:MAG: hypothetical protein IH899_15670 [Planctomycetes bacterium]|nr:hypothetical protein [Planctomycetota bacterium]
MQNQKNELWTKLELCIRRLLDNPSIMHDKKLDYELGMNIEEINSLAGTEIFRVETTDTETFLIIRNPKLSEEFAERWCVHSKGWGCVFDHPNTKRDKFNRTIECLRAWQSEFTQEGALSDVSTGKPTVGKNDGKMGNRQQILGLARQMREEIAQGDSSIHYKFKLACETFSEAIRLGAFYGASYFPLRRIMDLEQYTSTGLRVTYGMVFSRAVDWIRANPKEFSFTLPVFYKSKARDHMKEIQKGRVSRGFYEINIPAVAEVIELLLRKQNRWAELALR